MKNSNGFLAAASFYTMNAVQSNHKIVDFANGVTWCY